MEKSHGTHRPLFVYTSIKMRNNALVRLSSVVFPLLEVAAPGPERGAATSLAHSCRRAISPSSSATFPEITSPPSVQYASAEEKSPS